MKIKYTTLVHFGIILAVSILIGAISVSITHASPPLQDTRPPQNGGGSSGGGGGGGGAGGDGSSGGNGSDPGCASLVGQMINWGSGGEGGVTAELNAGSWQLSTVSATDGNYGFGGLGVGVAVLHVAFTPEQNARFQPLIQDAGVYLNCQFPIIANVALANDVTIDPPVTIEMSASRTTLSPGQNTNITLTINNGLPNEITNVVVTDLFTSGLTPIEATADVDSSIIRIVDGYEDGQLVAVYLDKVATGAEVTITITVVGDTGLANATEVSNVATLFYRESVAHQASLDFTIRGGVSIPAPLAATVTAAPTDATPEADSFALSTPEPTPTIPSPPTTVPTDIVSPTATNEAGDGEDFAPPPGELPTTGDGFALPFTGQISNIGLNPLLPLGGLALAGLTFILYQGHAAFDRYKRRRKREEAQRARIEDETATNAVSASESSIQTNEVGNQE